MTAPARRRRPPSAARLVLGLGLSLTLFAGCTGQGAVSDPTTAGTTSPSPTTGVSAEPTATPTVPAWTPALDEVSPDGAAAVVQYFFELYPYVVSTGDTSAWDQLSHPDCAFCADVSQTYGGTPSATPPPALVLTLVSATELDPGVLFDVQYQVTETRSDGVTRTSALLAAVVWDQGSWAIQGIQVDPVAPDA